MRVLLRRIHKSCYMQNQSDFETVTLFVPKSLQVRYAVELGVEAVE
jgi:hypothetical protein